MAEFVSSQIFLPVLLGVGLFLALSRPYNAFLLGVFVLCAFYPGDLAQSRTFLGPYFNGLDACVVIAIVATMKDTQRLGSLIVPKVVVAVIAVLFIATLQTVWKLGPTYYTIRALRWALTFPLWFFVASNIVTDRARVRSLLIILLAGTIVVSLQGVSHSSSRFDQYIVSENYALIRNSRLTGASVFILPALIVWSFPRQLWQKCVYLGSIILFTISIVLSQTRSMWFAILVTLPVIWSLGLPLRSRMLGLPKLIFLTAFVVSLSFVGFRFLFPSVDLLDMVSYRILELGDSSGSIVSRTRALDYELQAWLNSPIIVGQGLSYFQGAFGLGMALNHLGYLTYLAQLGILGFVVYAVFVPFSVIRNSIQVLSNTSDWVLGFFALLSATCMVYLSVVFFMSGSLLSHAPIPGILAGGIWALSKQLSKAEHAVSDMGGGRLDFPGVPQLVPKVYLII
jgi:O-Antigen ligase